MRATLREQISGYLRPAMCYRQVPFTGLELRFYLGLSHRRVLVREAVKNMTREELENFFRNFIWAWHQRHLSCWREELNQFLGPPIISPAGASLRPELAGDRRHVWIWLRESDGGSIDKLLLSIRGEAEELFGFMADIFLPLPH